MLSPGQAIPSGRASFFAKALDRAEAGFISVDVMSLRERTRPGRGLSGRARPYWSRSHFRLIWGGERPLSLGRILLNACSY